MAKGQTKAAEKAAEYLEKNPGAAPMQVAVKFGISLSTVYRLERNVINANARLIAAAPDLLAALQGMVDSWNMVCDVNGWERDHIQQQKDAVAAINKATGSAP